MSQRHLLLYKKLFTPVSERSKQTCLLNSPNSFCEQYWWLAKREILTSFVYAWKLKLSAHYEAKIQVILCSCGKGRWLLWSWSTCGTCCYGCYGASQTPIFSKAPVKIMDHPDLKSFVKLSCWQSTLSFFFLDSGNDLERIHKSHTYLQPNFVF